MFAVKAILSELKRCLQGNYRRWSGYWSGQTHYRFTQTSEEHIIGAAFTGLGPRKLTTTQLIL